MTTKEKDMESLPKGKVTNIGLLRIAHCPNPKCKKKVFPLKRKTEKRNWHECPGCRKIFEV